MRAIMERFYLLSEVPLAILAGVGVFVFLEKAKAYFLKVKPQKIGRLCSLIFPLLVLLLPLGLIKYHYKHLKLVSSPIIDNYMKEMLDSVDKNGILLAQGDMPHMGTEYLQFVEGYRTDIKFIDQILYNFAPWYQDLIKRRFPNLAFPEPNPRFYFETSKEIIRLNRQHSVSFLADTDEPADIERLKDEFSLYHLGLFFHLPHQEDGFNFKKLNAKNRKFFQESKQSLDLAEIASFKPFYPYTGWYQDIRINYSRSHYNFALNLEKEGNLDEAIEEYKKALILDPNFIDAQFALANVYFELARNKLAYFEKKDYQRAREYYIRLLKQPKFKYAVAYQKLADIYKQTGEIKKAENYQKAYDELVEKYQ